MRIVQINSVSGNGSTGKICVAVSQLLNQKKIENYIFYAVGNSKYVFSKKYMFDIEVKLQALKSRIFGNYGFQSKMATRRLIKELEEIKPDIIHLHNLHSHNIHLGIFLEYLKKTKIKIFWTFHDCWGFTGYCSYYDLVKCDQWKNKGCQKCILAKHYSWFLNKSDYVFREKERLLTNLDFTIITPSRWLKEQVKESFLRFHDVKVINNGVDLSVFHPVESDFRKIYNLENKKIVLGVAFEWGYRKGLDVFSTLANKLDNNYQIILVGTNNQIDKTLPRNIISIHRTRSQEQLVEIYSAADVFVNPTRDEVFGLVNVEANACGTPVITFDSGGSPECIDERSGIVVPCDDLVSLINAIKKVCYDFPFDKSDCVNRAKKFNQNDKYNEYIDLYFSSENL